MIRLCETGTIYLIDIGRKEHEYAQLTNKRVLIQSAESCGAALGPTVRICLDSSLISYQPSVLYYSGPLSSSIIYDMSSYTSHTISILEAF